MASRRWFPLSAALLSGAMLAASFPPLGWDFLAWFAFVPLLWSLTGATPKQAAGRGYVIGLFFMGGVGLFTTSFGDGVLWMAILPWVLFTAIEALWFIPACIALSVVLRPTSRVWPILFSVPAIWVLGEWARGTGTYGFPFGYLASAALGSPVAQLASIGGCYLVSGAVALVGTAFFLLVRGDRPARRTATLGLLLLAAPAFAWGMYSRVSDFASQIGRDSSLAMAPVLLAQGQTNAPWGSPEANAAFNALRERTCRARTKPELIVWSESSVPGALPMDTWLMQQTTAVAARMKAPLLTGAISYTPSGAPTNTALLIRPDGSVAGTYRKRQLVPFGEFVPGRHVLPFLSDFGVVERDEEPGNRYNLLTDGRLRIGAPICFESASPKASRAFAREGANLLVVITNDAWFGRYTGMPEQHLAAARLRAIETRRWVVRCGNTGISAFISPTGEVEGSLPLGRAGVLSGDVVLRSDVSPYVRRGDWFLLVCALTAIAAVWSQMGHQTPRD